MRKYTEDRGKGKRISLCGWLFPRTTLFGEWHLAPAITSASVIMLMAFALNPPLLSQSTLPSQNIEELKSNKAFRWGEGFGPTPKEADLHALNDLASRISVTVESKFVNLVEERGDSLRRFSQSAISTYTHTSLRQAEKIETPSENGFYCFRYISTENLDKVFADRQSKVISSTVTAMRAEEEGRIGHALQLLYDAYVLLRTHPDNASIGYSFYPGQPEVLLSVALPDAIRRILSGIRFETLEDKITEANRSVTFRVLYNNQKVNALEYEYYDGNRYDKPASVNNGITYVWFPLQHRDMEDVQLKIQYRRERVKEDKELEHALNTISVYHFKEANLNVPLLPPALSASLQNDVRKGKEALVLKPRPASGLPQNATDGSDLGNLNLGPRLPADVLTIEDRGNIGQVDTMRAIVNRIVEAMEKKAPERVRELFSSDGYDMFLRFLADAKVSVLLKDLNMPDVLRFRDHYELRSIPVSLKYRTSLREFPEKVNFSFDTTGRIVTGISYALSDRAIQNILEKGEGDRFGTYEEKFHLIHFMEEYQTAYAFKRLDYIRSIFDDNAYILVGNVLRNAGPITDEVYKGLSSDSKVTYIRRSKAEFMDQLSIVFRGNEYINLEFLETDFKKSNDKKIYGIQLEQHYFSPSYYDHGYLFLMLDMSDSLNPLIYVRTWQPEKDSNGEIPSLANFRY